MTAPQTSDVRDAVEAAFLALQQALEQQRREARQRAAAALAADDYERARRAIADAEDLERRLAAVGGQQEQWRTRHPVKHTPTRPPAPPSPPPGPAGLELEMAYRRARARARYASGRVTLLAGSTISAPDHASLSDALRDLRRDLKRKGKLVEVSPDLLRLEGIHTFGSPSGAAQFVAGASVSGNRDWKVAGKGITLGEWLSHKGARS